MEELIGNPGVLGYLCCYTYFLMPDTDIKYDVNLRGLWLRSTQGAITYIGCLRENFARVVLTTWRLCDLTPTSMMGLTLPRQGCLDLIGTVG